MSLSSDEKKVPFIKSPAEADAWSLFQASDPLGTKKDFEVLKPKLLAYIEEVMKREALEDLLGAEEAQKNLSWLVTSPQPPDSMAINAEGFPAIGPVGSVTSVIQFVDFLCLNCSAYNVKFAELVEKYREKVRFSFLPFPYSRPDRSIGLARGSLCAHEQKKYLDFHMQVVSLGEHAAEAAPPVLAKSSGLDLRSFLSCYRTGQGVAQLLALSEAQAKRVGLLKTPVSFLGSKAFYGLQGLTDLSKELESVSHQNLPSSSQSIDR
jgi:protein-disulfide isomerase